MNKKLLFWLIPLILFALQIPMSVGGNHQIRNEEAVWSLREVWWFKNRLLYAPANSNVGWYAVLNIIYALFGFSIFSAKIYRLVLAFFSLFSLAALLKKYLGEKLSITVLLTIGLSPTFVFFNTLATGYGTDLQFLPIVIFCIASRGYFSFVGWALAMVGWLTYPTFGFYLPALAIWYIFHLRIRDILAGLGAFLVPLFAVLVYFGHWPGRLFFSGGSFLFDEQMFFQSIAASFTNLFDRATAYYLEVNQVEFSQIYPILTFLFVPVVAFLIFKRFKTVRLLIGLCILTALLDLVLTGVTIDGGVPGGRRSTPLIASIYGLFTISYYFVVSGKLKMPWSKGISIALFSLFLLHHIVVYPMNLSAMFQKSPFRLTIWFGEGDPVSGFTKLLDQIQQQDLYFNCEQTYPDNPQCQYGLIYSALRQACFWNHLDCHKSYGYFPQVGYQVLSIDTINYWQENGFEH